VSAVPWQIPGCGEQQAVRRHGNRVGDAGYPIGEVGQKPAEILRSCHASCSLPPCGGFPGVVDSGFFASSAVRVRPRCTPRWYAESRPRTCSGERRLAVVATFSTPPGTSWAIGTRRGRPADVVPSTCGSAACAAADQPSSAAVCQACCGPPLADTPAGTTGGGVAARGTRGGAAGGGGTGGAAGGGAGGAAGGWLGW